MSRLILALFALALILVPDPFSARADEGMWLPPTIAKDLPMEKLREMGFKLKASDVWSNDAASLKDAMLKVGNGAPGGPFQGFGSASFVSSKGLILTNHHVAFDAITALSSPEENLIKSGFVAKTMKDERPCPGSAMRITTRFEEVTDRVLAGVGASTSEADRAAAVEKATDAILAEAKKAGLKDCEVKDLLYGSRYFLLAYETLYDIRLVYAPQQAIGEYGGDTDNWMWPRHTGDFTYFRAYVAADGSPAAYSEDNVPFTPAKFLEVSAAGYDEGDFVFIMGHPAQTLRYRTSYSLAFHQNQVFPRNIEALERMLGDLMERGKENPEFAISSASDVKSIANTLKNYRGKSDGFTQWDLVNERRRAEDVFHVWAAEKPERQDRFGSIYSDVAKLYEMIEGRDQLSRADQAQLNEDFAAKITAVRRRMVAGMAEQKGSALYPDADFTIRFTYGTVKGYSPRDGVTMRYYTTPDGIVEKHSGEEPFDAPEKLRALVAKKDWGEWGDADLGTMPVCFLSDTDITGGNSGSPIMDGSGRMIGLAFDGNYEAMISDYEYQPNITRTINVDIRYVLWCTQKLAGLDRLVQEMKIVKPKKSL